jgi:hypothetical protein
MKRSIIPTNHILINTHSTIDLCIDYFAIIYLPKSFRVILQQRLETLDILTSDKSFHNLSYWDSSCQFYCDQESKLYTDKIIIPNDEWAFIDLEPGEEQSLFVPKEALEAHQFVITKNGYANFKALSKYTNEVYMTETISIKELLNCYVSESDDTS